MKNVWESCRFSDEIISTNFSKAKFAVELHEFLDGTADTTYQDPQTFFKNTFLTDQMKLLIEDTLGRLSSGRGEPVTIIDTGFGGGKTHSLLLLHHILSSPDAGRDFVRRNLQITDIPQAKIVEIDCRQITKKTLWGEIAHKLGRYDEFEQMDTAIEPPTDISAIKRLFEGPVLIMIDELPHYLAKVSTKQMGKKYLSDITSLFIMDLISAVAASPRASLILTLTEKQSLYKEYTDDIRAKMKRLTEFRIDETVDILNEAISRQAHTITPVNRNQIYNVVKARLVQHIDESERDITIQQYAEYYEKHCIDVGDLIEKMKQSYPFHPHLIDTLHDRVSTIGKFNKTRGMLRLLALVSRHVVKNKPSCKIIGASEVKFDNPNIKNELTVRLGLDLGTVIDTDCVGHAKDADKTKSVKVVESVAASIMLFSLHAHTKKSGQRRGDIKAAVGYPGLEPSLIDKALEEDIMRNFWYIQEVGGQEFYFTEFPNINAIIFEHKKSVSKSDIRDEIDQEMSNLLPSGGFRIVRKPDDLDDDESLKLFVAPYNMNLLDDAGKDNLSRMLSRCSDNIRTHKNTITTVCAEPSHVPRLESDARTLVAIKKAKKDDRVRADKKFVRDMDSKESDYSGQLNKSCFEAYYHVLYHQGPSLQHSEIIFGESRKRNITEAVIELLRNRGKLVDRITPDGLEVGTQPIQIKQLRDNFVQDAFRTFILDKRSIGDAVKDGISSKKFGYFRNEKRDGDKYVVEKAARDFEWDGYLVDGGECVWPTPQEPEQQKQIDDTTSNGTGASSYAYTLYLSKFGEIRYIINAIIILDLEKEWKTAKKQFRANVYMKDVRLDIGSDLSNHKNLKELLSFISGRMPNGNATLTISSDKPLDAFFKKHDLENYIQ